MVRSSLATCVHVYAYIYVYMYIHIYIHMCIYICILCIIYIYIYTHKPSEVFPCSAFVLTKTGFWDKRHISVPRSTFCILLIFEPNLCVNGRLSLTRFSPQKARRNFGMKQRFFDKTPHISTFSRKSTHKVLLEGPDIYIYIYLYEKTCTARNHRRGSWFAC